MTRPTAFDRRSPVGVATAALTGLVVGCLQTIVFVCYLRSTQPDTSPDHADRGFGSNPNIGVELFWLTAFVVVSVALVTIALAMLRIRWYGLVMPVVLAIEFGIGGGIGSVLPGHNDWRSLVLARCSPSNCRPAG